MYKAFVLVRNVECNAQTLDFGDFTIGPIGTRSKDLEFFGDDVGPDDWIFEKSYSPPPVGSALLDDHILRDIEDVASPSALQRRRHIIHQGGYSRIE